MEKFQTVDRLSKNTGSPVPKPGSGFGPGLPQDLNGCKYEFNWVIV